jgi:hypothetical protein
MKMKDPEKTIIGHIVLNERILPIKIDPIENNITKNSIGTKKNILLNE